MSTTNPIASPADGFVQQVLQETKNALASKIHDYVKAKGIQGNFEWNAHGDIYQNNRVVMQIEDPSIIKQLGEYIKLHQELTASTPKAAANRATAPQEPPKTNFSSLPNQPSPPVSLFAQNTPPQEAPKTNFPSLPNHRSPPASLFPQTTPQQRSQIPSQTPSQNTRTSTAHSSLNERRCLREKIEERYLKEKLKNLENKKNQLAEALRVKKDYKDSDKIGSWVTQLTRGWVNDYTTLDQQIETIETELANIKAERRALFNILSFESKELSLRVEAMILEKECLEKNQTIEGCDIHFGQNALKPLKVAHLSFSALSEKSDAEIEQHIQALKSTLKKINQRIVAIDTLNS